MAANLDGNSNVVTWKGTQIHLGAIDRELTRLWQDGAEAGHSPVTRTRVLNLIVVTSSSDGAQRVREIVCDMAGQHPSRTIILVSRPDVDDIETSLDAEIEAHRLHTGRVSGDVSWEMVTVSARGRAAFHPAAVVNPLLITDLPTFLWWAGEPPFESELFNRLLAISNRVLVDSRSFKSSLEKDLGRLARLIRRSDHVALSDFNWARIRPWVEGVIQIFDSQLNRAYLGGIHSFQVEYEAHVDDPEPNPAQALLFVSWMASRLGWTPDKGRKRLKHGGWMIPMVSKHGAVVAEIVGCDSRRCSSGEIAGVTVKSSWLGRGAECSIHRTPDRGHATSSMAIEGEAAQTKTFEFERNNESNLLLEELNVFSRDQAFEDALDMAATVLGNGPAPAKARNLT